MIAAHPRCNIVLAGDFNACLLKTGSGTPGAKLREILNINRLIPVNVKTPTYRPLGSLLDIIATSRPEQVVRAGVTHCFYGGPHDITRLMIRQGRDRRECSSTAVYKRCLGRIDTDQFNASLCQTDWNSVWTSGSTEAAWEVSGT